MAKTAKKAAKKAVKKAAKKAAPKKAAKKTGFWMARLVDCIAEINSLSDNRANPNITEPDQA